MNETGRVERSLRCTACEWSASTTDEVTGWDPNRAAIDHHAETGHTIERASISRRESTGWADEWPPAE